MTEDTPGIARTVSSTFLRIGSQAFTAPASTLIEKNTFPSLTTMSDSVPVFGKGLPSGALMPARRSRISCFVGAMAFSPALDKARIGQVNARVDAAVEAVTLAPRIASGRSGRLTEE